MCDLACWGSPGLPFIGQEITTSLVTSPSIPVHQHNNLFPPISCLFPLIFACLLTCVQLLIQILLSEYAIHTIVPCYLLVGTTPGGTHIFSNSPPLPPPTISSGPLVCACPLQAYTYMLVYILGCGYYSSWRHPQASVTSTLLAPPLFPC